MSKLGPLFTCGGAVLAAALVLSFQGCRPEVPAAPPPPAAVLVPPLHDAEAGEELVLCSPDGSYEQVFRVVSASDLEVEVEYTEYRNGEPVPGKKTNYRWHRNGFAIPEGMVVRRIDREEITLDHMEGSPTLNCWRLHLYSRSGNRVYWFSEKFPVQGWVKIARLTDKGRLEEELGFFVTRSRFPGTR